MSLAVSGYRSSYLNSCKRHNMLPKAAVLSMFKEDNLMERRKIVILLNQLSDADFALLVDFFNSSDSSEIEAVDAVQNSPCDLNKDNVFSLIRAINSRLRVLDLQNMSLDEKDLRDLFDTGFRCQSLNIMSKDIRNVDIFGTYMKIETLNLDFCASISTLQKDTFACLRNLARLSMCETRVSNLWATTAALYKLPSLVELRFQNELCCQDTGPSTTIHACGKARSNYSIEVCCSELDVQDTANLAGTSTFLKKYILHHPSPICFEKHYREYMITSLPKLQVLDNLSIAKTEKEIAKKVDRKHYEFLPYNRQKKESVVSILHTRETGSPNQKSGYSKFGYSRSLCAAKLCDWPLLERVSYETDNNLYKGESLIRPRQFEYHPSYSSLMAFGTLDGEVMVINHEKRNLVSYIPCFGETNSILGLSWLKKYPFKILAGSDNGSLRLYDIKNTKSNAAITFDKFDQLTSVHVNSTDDRILASGYSKKVAIYDINTGKRVELFSKMHQEPINVSKFANHSPFLFITSSFDRYIKMWDLRQKPVQPCYSSSSSKGNVMACFSPDDLYILVSSVDNEVKQLSAADGRFQMNFEIASTGRIHNYTRSYYLNGRDYIISGSSDEPVVRICCAQTGRRLRDIYIKSKEMESLMNVQSLRGDPFRHFHMAVLAARARPSSKWEIIKVNLLASNHITKDCSNDQQFSASYKHGG